MDQYYLIAAGGTGALCARAFIYMAAAGCANENAVYHVLIMDKDKESDAATACQNLHKNYQAMREQLGKKEGTFCFPEIVLHTWNFTEEIVDEYQLRTGGRAEDLSSLTLNKLLNPLSDPDTTRLLYTMYTPDELDTELDKGFYGHPNIGAPVFDYVRERFLSPTVMKSDGSRAKNTFMHSLHNSLRVGKAYVYLFGSLFGGTGATIIPNVALALADLRDPGNPEICYGRDHLVLGSTVVMPYFRLPSCPVDSVEALEKVSPVDIKFLDQTKEALSYYHESKLLDHMMNMLLVGTSELDVTSELYSRGGVQGQHFHLVHLLAATAANRFFTNRLGDMEQQVKDEKVTPLGELLLWKVTPDDPAAAGTFATLTPSEMDLAEEYDKMMSFLRFSVVVAFYMRLKFKKNHLDLMNMVEILGTYKQEKLAGKQVQKENLNQVSLDLLYQSPVTKAGAICRGFIEFLFDVSLTGYDWSGYRFHQHSELPARVVDGRNYFDYKLGPVNPNAAGNFKQRWLDFANLTELKQLVETDSMEYIVNEKSLNDISSYYMLDEDRAPYVEDRFPNGVAQVYENKTLKNLGLYLPLFSRRPRRDNVFFCEIYDMLYSLCKGEE